MEVTVVKFSLMNCARLFTASLDKCFRVYDIGSKQLIKQIQAGSPILVATIDVAENLAYLGCENLNIYQMSLNDPSQKKTMTHKKRITCLTLSTDGQRLISGDAAGLIYVWHLSSEDLTLKTFELHKDKG